MKVFYNHNVNLYEMNKKINELNEIIQKMENVNKLNVTKSNEDKFKGIIISDYNNDEVTIITDEEMKKMKEQGIEPNDVSIDSNEEYV